MTPTTETKSTSFTTASVIALLAGIWLFISPWIYGMYGAANAWNSWIIGAVIVTLSSFRLGYPMNTQWISWINVLLGIWMFISPWVYGYTVSQGRFTNSLCVGVIVFFAALRNAMAAPHTGHPLTTHT